jgi:hypothetical protein
MTTPGPLSGYDLPVAGPLAIPPWRATTGRPGIG